MVPHQTAATAKIPAVLVDIERQETHFEHTMVIFGNVLLYITVFLVENLWKITIVSILKLLKINRTPASYIHQYGSLDIFWIYSNDVL